MPTQPNNGNRFEALLARLPPLMDNPDFAVNVVGVLRRGHRIRAAIIGGSVLAGLAGMLALVPFEIFGDTIAFLSSWSGSFGFTAPELTKENGIGAGVMLVIFLVSLMATQEN